MLYCDTPPALKALMPGALVAFTSPQARAARDVVAQIDGVSTATLMGDGVHIVVDDAQKRIPALTAALKAGHITHDPLEQIAPSIEDLFVSLLAPTGAI